MNEPEERLVGHALAIGAVKGAVAGLLVGSLLALAAHSAGSWVATKVLLGAIFGGAWICSVDAGASCVRYAERRTLLRFVAGFGAPVAILAPHAGVLDLATVSSVLRDALLPLVLASAGLGFGFVAAGNGTTEPYEAQGCLRLLRVTLVAPVWILVVGVVLLEGPPTRHLPDVWLAATLVLGVASFALWLAQIVGGCAVARRVALVLDPEHVRVVEARRSPSFVLELIASALRKASLDRERADTLRLEALADLDRLVATLPGRIEPGILADRRAEALLGLGRLDDAEWLADRVSYPLALRAELARRRGDFDGAVSIMESWLRELRELRELPSRIQSSRATAHGILALVRTDQGRHEEARAQAAIARGVPEWFARAYEYLAVPAVDRYLAERSHA